MRDVLKAKLIKRKLQEVGVHVVSTQQEFDVGPQGALMETIAQAFDEYESAVNGQRTASSMHHLVGEGYFPGSRAPYGYRRELVAEAGAKRSRLVVDECESAVVRLIFELSALGRGDKSIAMELTQRGIRQRKSRKWSKSTVAAVLTESAHGGTYVWGKRLGKSRELAPEDKSTRLSVEPTVSPELYQAAMAARARRLPSAEPHTSYRSELLLVGPGKCSRCGSGLGLETSGKKRAEGSYRYYNCQRFLKMGRAECKGCRVPVDVLEGAVVQHLSESVFTIDRTRDLLRGLAAEASKVNETHNAVRTGVLRELAVVRKKIERWETAFEERDEDADLILPKLRTLRARESELSSQLEEQPRVRVVPTHFYTEGAIRRFQGAMKARMSGDPVVARRYIRLLVERIDVSTTEVTVSGRSAAAVRLMEDAEMNTPPSELTGEGGVLSYGNAWLPQGA
jgi:DNA invertase Pin-like site-specific DNA recombinase